MRPSRRGKQGFTLIELLVVVSIIALLVSILMPALSKAREQAKMVICKTNLKQWGTMLFMYASDYDDSFFPGPGSKPDKRWMEVLLPYYADGSDGTGGAGEIRCCPNATLPMTEGGKHPRAAWGVFEANDKDYQMEGHYGSYGANWWICNTPSNFTGTYFPGKYDADKVKRQWRKITSIRSAETVPMFCDALYYGVWPESYDMAPTFNGEATHVHLQNEMRNVCFDRHAEKINMTMADMSVASHKLQDLWGLKWHREWPSTATMQPWPDWMK